MTHTLVAKEIIRQEGSCTDIVCEDCPFEKDAHCYGGISLTNKALEWLTGNSLPTNTNIKPKSTNKKLLQSARWF